MYLDVFESEIQNVPCLIGITEYIPAIPERWTMAWEDSSPGYDAEIEFEVLKLTERPYPWLEQKMNSQDYDRIINEIESRRQAHKA